MLFALTTTQWAQAQNVAKVGSTEYATIEEAVEAWGPGKTLTLLADVQTTSTVTVEVNATKGTSNWILQLGNYTWTANGCNAFKLYAAGGTVMNQNYGLKIYANESGGIKASGKYCIECSYDNSTAGYRPRLEIHGGTYEGSYIVYYNILTWNRTSVSNGPSTHFFKSDDGTEPVFNGNFALAKCPITIYAGYFNGTSFNTYPVSSTANTNLYGGHFKTISAFPSASNNKGIIFGNYKVFVKSDASIDVINGAPAVYEAKATKTLLLSTNQSVNYSDYVFYEKANDAINKYSYSTIEIILSEGVTATQNKSFRSGTLTIDATAENSEYTGNVTLTSTSAKLIIKFPEGKGHYGVTASTGQLHVEESVADGIVTRTYSVKNVSDPEAKVGDTGYSTVYDAFYAIDGTTDNKTIVLQKDVTNAGIVTNGTAVNATGKTVATFDLNGKSIGIGSVAAGNNADYTLTIIDSSEDKTGTVTNSDASLLILALTGINDYSGTYTLKIQAGTWHFDPSNVTIKGEIHNLVDEGYVAHDNGNGTWTVGELPSVAKIGNVKYATLQQAVDAAQQMGGAQTINIIDDITGETVTIQEVANSHITIDGQKDASSNYTLDAIIVVDGLRSNGGSNTNGASVTLQNIDFVNGDYVTAQNTAVIQPSHYPHHLTIQDCKYTGKDTDASRNNWFVNIVDGPLYGTTIKNVTVEHSRLLQGNLGLDAVFENINATNDIYAGFNIKTEGTVLIKDCQVTTAKYAFRDYKEAYTGTITFESNTFVSTSEESDEGAIVNRGGAVGTAKINVVSGTYTGHVRVLNNKEGVLAISGGYFSEEFPQEYIAADLVAKGKICAPASDMTGYFTVGDPSYVAKIGDVKYLTLEAAVAAATEGQQIDILKDFELTTVTTSPNNKYNVNINKSVTINGNGYTITSSEGKRALVLTGEGNEITIKDLTIVNNKADWVLGITNNLTCTLDNTTIDANNFAGKYNQPLTIGSIAESGRVTLNVTNGSVIKTNDAGTAHYDIILWHPADITVTDSKLIGWANVYVKPDAAGSTINIEGSELKSQGLSGSSNSFAMITTESGQNTIVIKDTKITSSAVEGTYQSMFNINGQYNVLKVLGSTTYETNDTQWGAVTFNWFDQFNNNKVYFDETAKAAFEKYFDGSNCAVISDVKDQSVDLYPVNYSPEVMYYWPTADNNYSGTYCAFNQPFEEGWLVDGEFIELQKDITLTKNIIWQETAGSFNLHLGNYSITKGEYTLALNPEVTVLTDKQTDIFSSADAGYKVVETAAEEGADYKYAYSLEEIKSAPLLVFHDSGTYEEAINVMMVSRLTGATIKYQINDGSATTYSGPVAISSTSTLKAWLEVGSGQQIGDVITRTYTIVSPAAGPSVEGYYTIKNNGNSKNVNVAGRKTVTFVSDDDAQTAAGTVIKVKATNGKVEVLRSQGVDLPGYANRAMKYVPEMVKLVVDKLHADGSGEILGENGLDAIMQKFNESFDYNLYMEGDASGYRLYGRTPSMKPVVDFYAENKSNVDAKLPQLEDFINSAIEKVKTKLNGRGASILKPFSVHTIWQNMGGTLIEPTDAASTAQFYEEVLASEANVWSFAYETAMYYYEPLMASPSFQELAGQIGDYSKYLDKLPQIRPNFKYYIVANGNKVDYISEGNENIVNDDASTKWTLNERTQFNVQFDETKVKNLGTEYYTTLYTDFGYKLPEGVKAYKVSAIDNEGYATLEEVEGPIAAQTPIMLMTYDKNNLKPALTIADGGAAVEGNLLVGPDYLINEYEIKTKQVESLFNMVKDVLGENFYNNYLGDYEHLMMLNAGTVGNKYFFGMTVDGTLSDAYKAKTGSEMEESIIRVLGMGDYKLGYGGNKLGFFSSWDNIKANTAFLIHDSDPVKLIKMADVTRDGKINTDDVMATVKIIGSMDNVVPYKYDHDAADVKEVYNTINTNDVMGIVGIIGGQGNQQQNP